MNECSFSHGGPVKRAANAARDDRNARAGSPTLVAIFDRFAK
jgi:hypothetical protein